MKSFHNKQSVKTKYIKRLTAHYKADELIKGKYWENGKGCAVGCTIHDSNHMLYETELGLPEWLARVEDTLFEGLPNERAKKWPLEFLKAIKVGSNLNKVKAQFSIYILEEAKKSMLSSKYDEDKNPQVKAAIQQTEAAIDQVIQAHRTGGSAAWSAAESAASAAWSAAESAAWSAAESAAESAAWSAAESAARSAAESAARSAAWNAASAARSAASAAWSAARSAAWSAARSAAWSAAWSAARSAARSAAYVKYADKLLELLRKAQ